MLRILVVLTVIGPMASSLAMEGSEGPASEHVRVVAEACRGETDVRCIAELTKVCHAHLTFRCYYSRKARLDAVMQVGFPGEHSRGSDE